MNQRELRDCFGLFATGVMIATTSFEEALYGMTINSFASVSLDPALLLFSIDNKSSNLQVFQKAKNFTLSVLSEKQLLLAQEFAKPANKKKWQIEQHFNRKSLSPIFQNSLGYFECETYKIIEAGDHHIFIGKIIDCAKLNDFKPLIYLGGKFSFLQ